MTKVQFISEAAVDHHIRGQIKLQICTQSDLLRERQCDETTTLTGSSGFLYNI